MSDDETPSLQELLGDLHVGGTGLPDESLINDDQAMPESPEAEYVELAEERSLQQPVSPAWPDAGKPDENASG